MKRKLWRKDYKTRPSRPTGPLPNMAQRPTNERRDRSRWRDQALGSRDTPSHRDERTHLKAKDKILARRKPKSRKRWQKKKLKSCRKYFSGDTWQRQRQRWQRSNWYQTGHISCRSFHLPQDRYDKVGKISRHSVFFLSVNLSVCQSIRLYLSLRRSVYW